MVDPMGLFYDHSSGFWSSDSVSDFSYNSNLDFGTNDYFMGRSVDYAVQAHKPFSTWDPVTDRRITQLDDRIQEPATRFINQVEFKLNVQLRISQGFRSFAEQNALYAKGRTAPGPRVTNAKGGQSYHNYGLAIDVVEMKNRQPIWTPISQEVADIGIGLGFEWGGNWKTIKDYPHFQMTFGQTIRQLQSQK